MSTVLPGEISCGLLIHVYCQKLKDNDDGWSSEYLSKETQHKILIEILKIIRNVDCKWQHLEEKIRVACPEDVYNSFLKEVRSLNDEDHLLDILKTFEDMVTEGAMEEHTNAIKRTSVLGLFIRKLVLKLKKLNFVEIHQLLKDFVKYNSLSTTSTQDQSIQSMDLSCIDENTSDVSLAENKENVSSVELHTVTQKQSNNDIIEQDSFTSQRSVFKFIEKHVNMLESFAFEAPQPNILQEQIEKMQKLHPKITDVYYLSFLNYLRVSEVNKAGRMLCLYFDNKDFQTHPSNEDMSEQERHLTMFKRFRYGALNLGIMYCRCQKYDQALKVLKEAVCVAQETNDEVCLKYAMFWIQVVNEKTDNLNDPLMEARCSELIKELFAEDERVIDSIQDIDCFAIQRYIEISAFRGIQSPSYLLCILSRVIVSNSKVSDTALLSRSAMLDFYGLKLLSLYNLQLPLQTMTKLKKKQRCISEENWNLALMQLASQFIAFGCYEEAKSVQNVLWQDAFRPAFFCQDKLMFIRNVMERKLNDAVAIAECNMNDFERLYLLAVTDTARGDYTDAFKKVSKFRDNQRVSKKVLTNDNVLSPTLEIQMSLLLIELKLCSRNPGQAIDDILELWSSVTSLKMYSFLIDLHICLARYNLKFRLVGKALRLIDHIFTLTLANGTPHQQGVVYFLRARCLIEKAYKIEVNSSTESNEIGTDEENEFVDTKREEWCVITKHLEKSLSYFEKINARARLRDVYCKLSIVYHELGSTEKRNLYATKFRDLNEDLKNDSECLLF